MKPAFIVWRGKKTAIAERKAYLRSGAKGTGKVLAIVNYWPNSSYSVDQAGEIFQAQAQGMGYRIVGSDADQE